MWDAGCRRSPMHAGASAPISQRFAATMLPAFITATGTPAHWFPVASIPPSVPPEQGEASTVSIFEVLTGALGSGAALAIRLAPCADTVGAAGAPAIFAVGRVPAMADVDFWIPPILAVGWDEGMSESLAYALAVAVSPH